MHVYFMFLFTRTILYYYYDADPAAKPRPIGVVEASSRIGADSQAGDYFNTVAYLVKV